MSLQFHFLLAAPPPLHLHSMHVGPKTAPTAGLSSNCPKKVKNMQNPTKQNAGG
jgi:hypothetical protein